MTLNNTEAEQSTTFYLALQNNKKIDLRDNRGKKHNLPFILISFLVGLFRKRDGVLSSIHRSMQNTNVYLSEALGIDNEKVISRSHLPILLKKVSVEALSELIFEHFGIELSTGEKEWFSMDGKELRGTILACSTRGEAIVQSVRHSDRQVFNQGYYNGSKESEQPVVRTLLGQDKLASQGISLDSLHFNPTTLNLIVEQGGAYMVGLKGNQEEIQTDIKQLFTLLKPNYEQISEEKGHGREEVRTYCCMDVQKEYFEKRWDKTKFATAIKVIRTRYIEAQVDYSIETSYYMTNEIATDQSKANQLYTVIRNHWGVEVNNHIRDVTFKEDALQTKFKKVAQPIALLRTIALNIFQKEKIKNIVHKMELFMDDFNALMLFLKSVKVL